MPKLKLSALNIFTIFLPLSTLIGAIVITINFLIFPLHLVFKEPLKANITDGQFKSGEGIAFFNNKQISALNHPLPEARDFLADARVLAATDEEVNKRWIEINLAEQKLYAWEDDKKVNEFLISSGKWGRTPTGEFRIWSKLKYTLMHGGSPALNTYYYLPNVPYTQYFHQGYGLHGCYWHNNFGHPMSHGCVNMYTPDAEWLFFWTNPELPLDKWIVYPTKASPGTKVIIHGEAPWD